MPTSVVARSFQPTLWKNFVHNVDIPGSFQFSNCVFPVPVNVVKLTQDVCDKLPGTSSQASCPNFSSFIDCLQQDLVSPSMVTPMNAEKTLAWTLLPSCDQTQVDYVIRVSSNDFHLGFNPLGSIIKVCKSEHAFGITSAFSYWPVSSHGTWERRCHRPLLHSPHSKPSYQSLRDHP